nr:hypothetical protein OG409_36285 [Streptomyces sp. NBC_00974]
MPRAPTSSPQIVGVNSHRCADAYGNRIDEYTFSSEHGVQAMAVHNPETGKPMTAERVAEILRTETIEPAGPLPADRNGNIIQPRP